MVARDKERGSSTLWTRRWHERPLAISMMWYVFTREEIEDAKRLQHLLY